MLLGPGTERLLACFKMIEPCKPTHLSIFSLSFTCPICVEQRTLTLRKITALTYHSPQCI